MNSMFLKRAVALVLSCAVAVPLVPMFTGNSDVQADEFTKNIDNTRAGINPITDPDSSPTYGSLWKGNYVYFGKYNKEPIRFRVLDDSSDRFGGETLFLDSDNVLFEHVFDDAPYSKIWEECSLRKYLNNQFYNDSFTDTEKSAVWSSRADSHDYPGDIIDLMDYISTDYKSYTPLKDDKIFVLDIEDVCNKKYGYAYWDGMDSYSKKSNHQKTYPESDSCWWLRSAKTDFSNSVAYVDQKGYFANSVIQDPGSDPSSDIPIGVAPALNIDTDSILFSTLVSGEMSKPGAEYKLTLKDNDIKLDLSKTKEVTFEGNTVTVPYTLSGKNAGNVDQLSIAIESNGWFNLRYYKKLDVTPSANGTVSFELPEDFEPMRWGISYRIYLIAEDVNGMKETDYAGEPLLIENPGITLDVRTPFQADQEVRAYLGDLCYGQLINGFYTTEKDMKYDIDKDGEYDLIVYAEENGGYLAKLDNCKLRGSYDLNDLDEHYYKIKKYTFILSDLDVTLDKVSNGTATVSKTSALRDDEITVTAKPDTGYVLDKITYTPKGGSAVDITGTGKFTMPNCDVTVSVSFKKSAEPTAKPTVKPTDKPATVSLNLDKKTATVICGKNLTLKATLKGSTSKIVWKSSDTKVATVDSNGKINAKMAGAVTITASAAGKSASCKVTVLYKDVTNSKDFWYAPTNYLTAKGVVKGYDNQTKFKPANKCTRAQMVTFIWRLMGEPKPKTSKCKFSDVKKTDYFYKACIWGNENHIVEGYKDGTFGPQIVCARKHAVTFLWRLAGQPAPKAKTNKFKDVKKIDYFYKATLWASETNILAGYSDGTFRPNGDCLRRQMVTFLYKYDKFVNGKG
ncbi:MAG: S-layer homology domain-containing protein [Clostridiales bacterium]|nr:S-layer homology domain-containing protein [Clostridiales bacterium]